MSINSVGQYTASHKPWDHVGNITPVSEKSEGFRPWLEAMPAAWLPVQFYEKFYENWVVAMPGKILSADPQGRIVPAQYMLASSTVTYATNDVNNGTIDVRNGNACTSASVSASPITLGDVSAWMGVTGLTWSGKAPIGVASYPILQWAGDGSSTDDGNNPAYYRYHNYNMQHRVALVCDYMLELPVVPAVETTATITLGARTANLQVFDALSNLPVAKNTTTRTPFTFASGSYTDSSTRFVTEKSTAAACVSDGDWHIDLTTGIITVYTPTTLSGTYTLTYYHYASSPSTVSVFACATGDLRGGDFLKSDSNSNWTLATPQVYGTACENHDTFTYIMGQILEVQTESQDYLKRVRTAWSSLGTDGSGSLPGTTTGGQMDQMPGSATGGASLAVHYAGAADQVALVNLVSR